MKMLMRATLGLTLAATAMQAQVNAGEQPATPDAPFTVTKLGDFNLPWRIAVLPDGQLLVTEKVGPLWIVSQAPAGRGGGPTLRRVSVGNVPTVVAQGQGGMMGVYLSPNYATDHNIYLTYSEPGDSAAGSSLALARAVRRSPLYRMQGLALFIAVLIPWIANILYITGLSPIPGVDPTAPAFALSGVLIEIGRAHV